jgi:hypothetical protein
MFTIKTIIQQQVNALFGNVKKIQSWNLYFLNDAIAIYVVNLKNYYYKFVLVHIPLNGNKPFAVIREDL